MHVSCCAAKQQNQASMPALPAQQRTDRIAPASKLCWAEQFWGWLEERHIWTAIEEVMFRSVSSREGGERQRKGQRQRQRQRDSKERDKSKEHGPPTAQ